MTSDNLSVEFQRSAVKSKLSEFADLHLQFVHRATFSLVGEIYTICKTGVSHGWKNGAYNIGDKCCSVHMLCSMEILACIVCITLLSNAGVMKL